MVENIILLEFVARSDFVAVFAVMIWKTVSSIQWGLLATDDTVPFVRLDPVIYVTFWDRGAVSHAV